MSARRLLACSLSIVALWASVGCDTEEPPANVSATGGGGQDAGGASGEDANTDSSLDSGADSSQQETDADKPTAAHCVFFEFPDGSAGAGGSACDQGRSEVGTEQGALVPGAFLKTASFTPPRTVAFSTTVLTDGRILVAGGFNTVSAQVYDPATHTLENTGDMLMARNNPWAVPVDDGRVLFGGGVTETSTELYDPSTGTFSPGPSLPSGQVGVAATRLLDDTAVVFTRSGSTFTALRFDSAKNQFEAAGVTNLALNWASATTLSSGLVAILSNGAAYYNPESATFEDLGSSDLGCEGPVALLPDDKVLMVCNGDSSASVARTRVFDPESKTIKVGPTRYAARDFPAVAALASGSVLVAGGRNGCCLAPYELVAEMLPAEENAFRPLAGNPLIRNLVAIPGGGAVGFGLTDVHEFAQ